jgi:hypothetical protein
MALLIFSKKLCYTRLVAFNERFAQMHYGISYAFYDMSRVFALAAFHPQPSKS